tara:strand:+ start:36199 stop:36420 length:222 start_codon:yes stop_codon:yes gene_type:complete
MLQLIILMFIVASLKRNEAIMKTLILALVVLLVGCSDYEEGRKAEMHYCSMVENGYWGAYNPEIKCEEVVKND